MDSDSTDLAHLAEVAADLVHQLTDGPPTSVEHIPRGAMTWKFEVRANDEERFIARFYPPGREHVLEYEPDLLRRCARTGVPVPLVVADGRSGPRAPRPYLLYRRIPGQPLADRWVEMSQEQRLRVARQLLAALRLLFTVPIEGWGELVTGRRARDDSWEQLLARAFEEGLATAQRSQTLEAGLIRALLDLRGSLAALPPPQGGGLVWADVSPENVLVDEVGNLTGVLDFESCVGGASCANLGYCLASHFGTGFYESLRDAEEVEESSVFASHTELYAVIRALLIAQFAAPGPMPGGLPRKPVEEFLPGFRPATENLRRRLGEAPDCGLP